MSACKTAKLDEWKRGMLRRSSPKKPEEPFDKQGYLRVATKAATLEDYLTAGSPNGGALSSNGLEVVAKILEKDKSSKQQRYQLWEVFLAKAIKEERFGVLIGIYIGAFDPQQRRLPLVGKKVGAEIEHGVDISRLMRPWSELNGEAGFGETPANVSIANEFPKLIGGIVGMKKGESRLEYLKGAAGLIFLFSVGGHLRPKHRKIYQEALAKNVLDIASALEEEGAPCEAVGIIKKHWVAIRMANGAGERSKKIGESVLEKYQSYSREERWAFYEEIGSWLWQYGNPLGGCSTKWWDVQRSLSSDGERYRKDQEEQRVIGAIKRKMYGEQGFDTQKDVRLWGALYENVSIEKINNDPGLQRAWKLWQESEPEDIQKRWNFYVDMIEQLALPSETRKQYALKAFELWKSQHGNPLQKRNFLGMQEHRSNYDRGSYGTYQDPEPYFTVYPQILTVFDLLPKEEVLEYISGDLDAYMKAYQKFLGSKKSIMTLDGDTLGNLRSAAANYEGILENLHYRVWRKDEEVAKLQEKRKVFSKEINRVFDLRDRVKEMTEVLGDTASKRTRELLGQTQRCLSKDFHSDLVARVAEAFDEHKKSEIVEI